NKGTKHLPAAPSYGPEEGLVVNSQPNLSKQQVGCSVPRNPKGNQEAVLEGVGFHVHLLSANLAAHLDVVLAANHVEGIGNIEHIGSPLEGSKPAVPQRPVIAHQRGAQSATHAINARLR